MGLSTIERTTDGQVNFLLKSNRLKLRYLEHQIKIYNGVIGGLWTLQRQASEIRAEIKKLTETRQNIKASSDTYVYLTFDSNGDYIGAAKDETELEDIKAQVDVAKVKKQRVI